MLFTVLNQRQDCPFSTNRKKHPTHCNGDRGEGSWVKGLLSVNHCVQSVTYWSPQSWFYFWWMVSRFIKCEVLSTLLQHHINLYINEEIQAFIHLSKHLTTNFTPLYLHLYLHRVNSIKRSGRHWATNSSIIWAAALCLITLCYSENSSHDRMWWHDRNNKLNDKSRWDFFCTLYFSATRNILLAIQTFKYQKSIQRPFLSQSPNRVGSGPLGPPLSFVVGLIPSGNFSRGSFSILDSSGSSNRPTGNFGFLRGCLAGSDLPPGLELELLRKGQRSDDSIKQTDTSSINTA